MRVCCPMSPAWRACTRAGSSSRVAFASSPPSKYNLCDELPSPREASLIARRPEDDERALRVACGVCLVTVPERQPSRDGDVHAQSFISDPRGPRDRLVEGRPGAVHAPGLDEGHAEIRQEADARSVVGSEQRGGSREEVDRRRVVAAGERLLAGGREAPSCGVAQFPLARALGDRARGDSGTPARGGSRRSRPVRRAIHRPRRATRRTARAGPPARSSGPRRTPRLGSGGAGTPSRPSRPGRSVRVG